MSSNTQSTLSNLVEQHLTSLIREAAMINRHSKRGGFSAAASNDDVDGGNHRKNPKAQKNDHSQRKRRRMIHHEDINMALLRRGSEKLYLGDVTPPDGDAEVTMNANYQLTQLLKNANSINPGSLVNPSRIPRVDLNAYLASDNSVPPSCELGMTLHWLAVDGLTPLVPMNDPWNFSYQGGEGDRNSALDNNRPHHIEDVTPILRIDSRGNGSDDIRNGEQDTSIRIRELQHRLLSEELQLYYSRITSAVSSSNAPLEVVSKALNGIRYDKGIQELVPFLSRFVSTGLMEKKNLRNTEYARRLVRVFDAMLDNRNLHLDLHLHQLLTPVGTCIVAKNLSSSSHDDHWSLRVESGTCLAKACQIYGDQYTTMKPRCIKLLTQQALHLDRPLATQFGGIVGLSLFGPRTVDAFLLPLVKDYWERWEVQLEEVLNFKEHRNQAKEYELYMCQQALLNAVGVFLLNVTPQEQAKRIDISSLADVLGERLIPLQNEQTQYLMAIM